MTDQPWPSVVIGTAGHVDHGKSSLVKALTGIDPDRLSEEQRRQMTIELGFASMSLPDGALLSFIDVPGHERLIKTMLAGAGGIAAALLVVAADDGPMPQTREHLAILEQLHVLAGIVAITKADLVDDEWLALIRAEIAALLAPTPWRDAPVIAVSSRTGHGLPALRDALGSLAATMPPATATMSPRLSVDRVFTMPGHGTVVTGTLRDGPLTVGDPVRLYPGHRTGKIRALQTSGVARLQAGAGSRVAVNLAGIDRDHVRRGDVLALPAALRPSQRLDVMLTVLSLADVMIRHGFAATLFLGTREVPVRILLLDQEAVAPGESAVAQLHCAVPVVARPGDRGILRRSSPSATIAGGLILDADAPRHRRFQPAVTARLRALATGNLSSQLLTRLAAVPLTASALLADPPSGFDSGELTAEVARLVSDGQILTLGPGPSETADPLLMTTESFATRRGQLVDAISGFHETFPLQPGLPRPQAQRVLAMPAPAADAFIAAIAAAGDIVDDRATLRSSRFAIRFAPDRESAINAWERALTDHPFAPPPPATFGIEAAEVIALEHSGRVKRLDGDVVMHPTALTTMTAGILMTIDERGAVSLAEVRDQFATSRRYAQSVLEWLDRQRVTRRVGDRHVRGTCPAEPPAVENGHRA